MPTRLRTKRLCAKIFAALLVTLSCANFVGAQNDSEYKLKRGDNEYGFWGGGAFAATTVFGGLSDAEADERRFAVAAFRYGRTLAANDHLALQYTLDAIPMALAIGNVESETTATTPSGSVTTFTRGSAWANSRRTSRLPSLEPSST